MIEAALDRDTVAPFLEAVLATDDPVLRAAYTATGDSMLGLERDLEAFARDLGLPLATVQAAYAHGVRIADSIRKVAESVSAKLGFSEELTPEQLAAAMGLGGAG